MLIMPNNNDLVLRCQYIVQNLDKIYYLSTMSQNNPHKLERERESMNKLTKLRPRIMLGLHLQLKLEINLATHIELGVK